MFRFPEVTGRGGQGFMNTVYRAVAELITARPPGPVSGLTLTQFLLTD